MRETAQSSVKQSTCWVTRDRDHSRLHTSCPYNMRKMLPHIAEEYDYQTTNRLLMEKISHPRRNKLILDSLRTCDGQHRVTHYSGDSDSRKRRRIGAKVVRMLKSREQEDRNGMELMHSFAMLKYSAEGRRRSQVALEENKPHQSQGFDLLRRIGKIRKNTGLQCTKMETDSFWEATFECSLKKPPKTIHLGVQYEQSSSNTKKEKENIHPIFKVGHRKIDCNEGQVFGRGHTIFEVQYLRIMTKPDISDDVLFVLEINIRAKSSEQNEDGSQNKLAVIRSRPSPYCSLRNEARIRFGLNLAKVYPSIQLQVYRFKGLKCDKVGTIQIDLVEYASRINSEEHDKRTIQGGNRTIQGRVSGCLSRGHGMRRFEMSYQIYARYPQIDEFA